MTIPKIENMVGRTGRTVPNQFIIRHGVDMIFQSYNSKVCMVQGEQVILDPVYYDFSDTTKKYLSKFLGETIHEIRKKIATGEYIFKNLNL